MRKDRSDEHRSTVRVLAIFETLAQSDKGMTLSEVCRLIDAPKGSISPILHTMAREGFLTFDTESGRYSIGLKTYLAGKVYDRNDAVLKTIKQEMEHVVEQCGETCQLAVLDDDKVLYVARVDSPSPIRLISDEGKAFPAYCTAVGKALILDLSKEQMAEVLGDVFDRVTNKTLRNVSELFDEIVQARVRGYTYDNGEITNGVNCVAVPIRIHGGIVYALGVTVPAYRLDPEKKHRIIDALKETSARLESVFK